MQAWILAVGDEVLTGKTVNTNYAYIAEFLYLHGYSVRKGIIVGDDGASIQKEVLAFMASGDDLLVTTGGLGPTHDDFTKEEIAKALNLELTYFPPAAKDMENYFHQKKTDCNLKQTYYPKGAVLIPNPIGSADGFILNINGKHIVSLVGVPVEMKKLLESPSLDFLFKKRENNFLTQEYTIMGISESNLEEKLKNMFPEFPHLKICPYCDQARIRLQITGDKEHANEFNAALTWCKENLGDLLVGQGNVSIEEVVLKSLLKHKYHVSFAESCTGGMLASTLVNVSGASNVLHESYVTYSDVAKEKILKVDSGLIKRYGVVSPEVALAMAEGLMKICLCDVAVSVTGYAEGDISSGRVCYSIKTPEKTITKDVNFRGSRNMVRLRATRTILYDLYLALKEGDAGGN